MSLNTPAASTQKDASDQQTLNALFETHKDALRGYIGKRVQDPSQVDDVLQDVFIKLQSLKVEDIKYPKAYLYRMANNLIIDEQRRQSRFLEPHQSDNLQQNNHLESHPETQDERSPEAILNQAQRLSLVTKALQELPEKTRDAFCLLRFKQMDKQDVAGEMGISVNMVEKHVRKALEYCQMKIKKSE